MTIHDNRAAGMAVARVRSGCSLVGVWRESAMSLFGKKMRQSTRGWAHEAPPIEQDRSRWHPELTGLGPLTPDDVRNVAFTKPPLGKRGYNEDQVDAFLDRVEDTLKRRETRENT